MAHTFNGPYTGEHLNRVAMPMGGIGAGMISFEGSGKLSQISIRNQPAVFNEPWMFAAFHDGQSARLLEGPAPAWKILFPWGKEHEDAGTGGRSTTFGLPRMRDNTFAARFPFGTATLADDASPITAVVTGWSPFIPLDPDASSLPVCAVEYRLTNTSGRTIVGVFSFSAENFLHADPRHRNRKLEGYAAPTVDRTPHGFAFHASGFADMPSAESHIAFELDAADVSVDAAWFRGGWFDGKTVAWANVARGTPVDALPHADTPGGGGSVYAPVSLAPGETKTITLRICWYSPHSQLGSGEHSRGGPFSQSGQTHTPWYAGKFADVRTLAAHWRNEYGDLRKRTQLFTDAFYASTLAPEVIEAAAANLGILKSPTVLRQTDGRVWAWEGCFDVAGCCSGTCTHVWNYAQAMPHLFPSLERTLRETEHVVSQAKVEPGKGHQPFRMCLPIEEPRHDAYAAADGQLGGLIKCFREWRISGDTDWVSRLWPAMKDSLAYSIRQWDPQHTGLPYKPQHNTYDIEFWGPNGMIGTIYLAAIQAMILIGEALNDVDPLWPQLLARGKAALETELFNGQYFIQQTDRAIGLEDADGIAPVSAGALTPEVLALQKAEGPRYQYGEGCLSDGVIGSWFAEMAGVPDPIEPGKIRAHLTSVFKHNFRETLAHHANTQRPSYAMADESGLLLCTWPNGAKLTLPFPYSDEVWTGFEYQVACHCMRHGLVDEGLAIVRAARSRYDGVIRNPFDEFECGHWYARAMSSYGLLFGLTGIRYDAVDKTLHVAPRIPLPFTSFLSTAKGFGTVTVSASDVKVNVAMGEIDVRTIERH